MAAERNAPELRTAPNKCAHKERLRYGSGTHPSFERRQALAHVAEPPLLLVLRLREYEEALLAREELEGVGELAILLHAGKVYHVTQQHVTR